MKPFKNIFFDLGGVLFNIHVNETFYKLHQLGMPLPSTGLQTSGPMTDMPKAGADIVSLIHQVDVGALSADVFLEGILKLCRPGTTKEQVKAIYEGMIEVPASRLELLKRLRTKYKVYLLSNIGDVHWAAAQRMAEEQGHPMSECFDHCFCSFQMGVAKPDPRIFQRVIEESGVNPAESLYIDDFTENIKAGQEAGFIAYQIAGNSLEEHIPTLFPGI